LGAINSRCLNGGVARQEEKEDMKDKEGVLIEYGLTDGITESSRKKTSGKSKIPHLNQQATPDTNRPDTGGSLGNLMWGLKQNCYY